MRFRFHKKAMVSPVFKYIFVLIAGAVILAFFVFFAQRIVKQETKVIDVSVLYNLDASLQALSVSGNTVGLIPTQPWLSSVDIRFGTKVNCGKFTVGQRQYVPIEKVVFGPSLLSGKQLQVWTLSWEFPFRITNMFYFNNQRSKNYLVYTSDDQEFVTSLSSYAPKTVAKHLPEKFNIKPLAKSGVGQKSKEIETYDIVKFTSFSDMLIPEGAKGTIIKAYDCGEGKEEHECYGTVEFFEGEKYAFIGKEMLFGAILVDDPEVYRCQYTYALEELDRMVNLYKTKVSKLRDKKKPVCEAEYDNLLNNLLWGMEQHVISLKSDLSSLADAQILVSYAREIEEFNENELSGTAGCEPVY